MKNYWRNWNFMRIIRLVIGLIFLVQGIQTEQWTVVALAGLFTLMPICNIGCCSTTNCATNPISKRKQTF